MKTNHASPFFICVLCLFIASGFGASSNLLDNSGFENGTFGWFCWGGKGDDKPKNGKGNGLVVNVDHKWSGMHQEIAIPESMSFALVSGWIKTDNVIMGSQPWEKARIAVDFLDGDKNMVGGHQGVVGEADGTTDWTFYRTRYTIPAGAKLIKVICALGNAKGEARFDDISLTFKENAISQLPKSKNLVVNPGFEDDAAGWVIRKGTLTSNAKAGALCLYLKNETAQWSEAGQMILNNPNAVEVRVTGWMKTTNVKPGKESYQKARIQLEFKNELDARVGEHPPAIGEAIGTNDWIKLDKILKIPAGTKRIRLACQLFEGTGETWFDDISLFLLDKNGKTLPAGTVIAPADQHKWYPLAPDQFRADRHYVDWSGLLDAPAGKHGFLKTKGDALVFEDGTPARFWGTNLVDKDCFMDKKTADSTAERLAQMGANVLRLHHMDAPWASPNIFGNKGKTRKLDPASMDKLDYLIAQCIKRGVYIYLDLLVHRAFYPEDGIDVPPVADNKGAKQTGIFSKKLIELQKEYADQLLNHINPYTKRAYKDEPAIIGSEYINESTIYSHFEGDAIPPEYRKELNQMYQKAGHKGELPVFGLDWESGRGILKHVSGPTDAGKALPFLSSVEDQYFSTMRKSLRASGAKYPLASSNFPNPLLVMLKHAATQDVVLSNIYWDHPQIWRLANDWGRRKEAPFVNQSQLLHPTKNSVVDKAWFAVKDKPFMITEWNHCYPNEYNLEGAPFFAAFGALQGWDGLMQFDYKPQALASGPIRSFTLSSSPEDMALWVVAAPLFLRGDIKPAPSTIIEKVSDAKVYSLPSYSDYLDSNWTLPFITKVVKSFEKGKTEIPKKLAKRYDKKAGVVKSETGEISYNTKKGTLSLNAPRVQGAFGFIGSKKFDFPAFSFEVQNTHAAILAVSATTKPLVKSKRIYIAVVGPSKMTSQQYNPSRTSLLNPGTLPVLAQVIEGTVKVKGKPSKVSIYPKQADGQRGRAVKAKGEKGWTVFSPAEYNTPIFEVVRK